MHHSFLVAQNNIERIRRSHRYQGCTLGMGHFFPDPSTQQECLLLQALPSVPSWVTRLRQTRAHFNPFQIPSVICDTPVKVFS